MFRFIMCNKLYLQINCITIAHLSALSACLHVYLSLCRPVYPPACLFVYLFVCMISFKVLLLVLTYQALHGTAPQYMTDLLFRYQPTRSLRSSDALLLTITCQFDAFLIGARQFDACQFGALHFDAVPVRRVSVWRDASLARFTLARFPFLCLR